MFMRIAANHPLGEAVDHGVEHGQSSGVHAPDQALALQSFVRIDP